MVEDTFTYRSPARHLTLPIVEHSELAPGVRRMAVLSHELAAACAPGQFLHVLCHPGSDPLLRRPFSIHDAEPDLGMVSILYQIVGRGTQLLAERQVGETVDVLGPLGKGFTIPDDSDQPILLVGGGMAVAPLYFLARRIVETVGCTRMSVLIGARTSDMLLCVNDLTRLRVRIETATDDASHGRPGMVTDLIEQHLSEDRKPMIYACGPWAMLSAVARIANTHGLRCQVSTEARMACGVGACMGCAIKVRDDEGWKYVRCCREGPVFDAEQIVWE